MHGDKINRAIDLIINYAVGKEIRSNDMFIIAKAAGISSRTLENAKRLFKVESRRNAANERMWFIPEQDIDHIRGASSDVQPSLIEEIHKTLNLQPDLPIDYIKAQGNAKTFPQQTHEAHTRDDACSPLDLSHTKRVFLMCGATKFRGKFDYFAGCVPRKLTNNLTNGDVFIFCDWSRTQICILQWQGSGYAQYFKRSDYGQFPWLFKKNAQAVEVTPRELEILLEYPKLMLRLSGISQSLNEHNTNAKLVK